MHLREDVTGSLGIYWWTINKASSVEKLTRGPTNLSTLHQLEDQQLDTYLKINNRKPTGRSTTKSSARGPPVEDNHQNHLQEDNQQEIYLRNISFKSTGLPTTGH